THNHTHIHTHTQTHPHTHTHTYPHIYARTHTHTHTHTHTQRHTDTHTFSQGEILLPTNFHTNKYENEGYSMNTQISISTLDSTKYIFTRVEFFLFICIF